MGDLKEKNRELTRLNEKVLEQEAVITGLREAHDEASNEVDRLQLKLESAERAHKELKDQQDANPMDDAQKARAAALKAAREVLVPRSTFGGGPVKIDAFDLLEVARFIMGEEPDVKEDTEGKLLGGIRVGPGEVWAAPLGAEGTPPNEPWKLLGHTEGVEIFRNKSED